MSLTPGSQLGPYKLIALLGKGGMGEVYRAEDSRLGREVAIKVLTSAFSAETERVKRFEQEARAISALNHPNILTIHDLETYNETLCLVSELLEGETLRDRMSEKPMSPRKAAEIAHQIAKGLAAAHGKGIIHRDLKPENIFLVDDDRVKILDFGLAKLQYNDNESHDHAHTGRFSASGFGSNSQPALTIEGRILGTVSYMSPEQIRTEKLDGRSDIFSLGIILWEMLTGQRPFLGASPIEIMTSILKDELPELPQSLKIPPILERILHTCLAKHASARFHSAHDLAFALEEASGTANSSLSTSYSRVPEPKKTWLRRHVGHLLAVAGLVGFGIFQAYKPIEKIASYERISVRPGLIYNARFSKDGRDVLFSASWHGAPWQVQIAPLDTKEERPIGPPNAHLLSISPKGELAFNLGIENRAWRYCYRGTLAKALQVGGFASRDLLTEIESADFDSKGELAVVRILNNRYRLEYPMGNLIAESSGWISHARISPDDSAIAFVEHPIINDDIGYVHVWSKASGKVKRLTELWAGGIRGMAWNKDEIWFSATRETGMKGLWAVSRSGKVRSILQIPGDLMLEDIAQDGRVLLLCEENRGGVAAGQRNDPKVMELGLRDWSFPQDLSPDGKTLVIEEQSEASDTGYRIYLRRLDGSAIMQVGEGMLAVLSPDQAWVGAIQLKPEPHPVLFPTGPGNPQHLPSFGIASYSQIAFTPDGKLLISGNQPGQPRRLYLQDPKGNELKVLKEVPHDLEWFAVSPDGRYLISGDPSKRSLSDLKDPKKAPMEVKGWENDMQFISWAEDSTRIFVSRFTTDPIPFWRLDPITGQKETFMSLNLKQVPAIAVRRAYITPDGQTWALRYRQIQTDLYLAEGLK